MADLPNKPAELQPTPVEQTPPEAPRPVEVVPETEPVKETETVETPVDAAPEVVAAPQEAPPPPAPVAVAPAVSAKDPVTAQIEEVLSEDLTDAFLKMTPETQAQFKQKGEETAGKIREMIEQAKTNARKIFDLIRDWLKLTPGVNKFFLEQEAKIKTDKILRLKP